MSLLNETTKLVGADVFIVQNTIPVVEKPIGKFRLEFISNRGAKVWPNSKLQEDLVNVHRCRYIGIQEGLTHADILDLLKELDRAGFEWVHVEKLLDIEGKPGFTVAH